MLFIDDIKLSRPHRVKGTAVFLTSIRRGMPNVLLHHFKHNKVLHEQVVILCIATDAVPEVAKAERLRFKDFGQGFWGVDRALSDSWRRRTCPTCCAGAPRLDCASIQADTSYYLGRETLLPTRNPSLAFWRKRLFRFLSRNSRSATDFFSIPPNRVVEIGTQIEL